VEWSLAGEELGDVSDDQVWRVLRKHTIQLQRRRSWCISTDPEFGPKAADGVGLYWSSPDNAVVLCVDEKPHIQVWERAPGWLPHGKALNGFRHGLPAVRHQHAVVLPQKWPQAKYRSVTTQGAGAATSSIS
jgi:hypothetical protein